MIQAGVRRRRCGIADRVGQPSHQIARRRQVGHVAQPDQHHLRRRAPILRQLDLGRALQQHLPRPPEYRHLEAGSQRGTPYTLHFRQRRALGQRRDCAKPGQRVGQFQQIAQHEAEVGAPLMRLRRDGQGGRRVAGHDGLHEVEHGPAVGQAQHVLHRSRVHGCAGPLGDGLI